MKPSEVLSAASKWTKDFYAKDKNGAPTVVFSDNAARFCILGAFIACDPEHDYECHDKAKVLDPIILRRFPERLDRPTDIVVQFNDHPKTTYEEVISVLQEAGL